jgi:hypothetical protein
LDELMPELLHSGRKKHRPWTAQEQVIAEVAAACGLNCAEIGRLLNRRTCVVSYRLTGHKRQHLLISGTQWTRQERTLAEVAAACGLSFSAIGKFLKCSPRAVKCRLSPFAAEQERKNARNRYHANPQKRLEQCRRYREANHQKTLEASRSRYMAGREKHKKRCREWAKANRDKVLDIQRKYRERHPEKVKEIARRHRLLNPSKAQARCRRACALRRAAKRRALLPATPPAIEARFNIWNKRCAFCGVKANHPRNLGHRRLTEDHVLPLSMRGLDEVDNIMPACSTCNSSKHNRSVESWYRNQPFFTDARWRKIQRHCPAAVIGQLPLALPA